MRSVLKADNVTALLSRSGNLKLLESSVSFQAFTWIASPLPYSTARVQRSRATQVCLVDTNMSYAYLWILSMEFVSYHPSGAWDF
jgi:hypothetical protein